MYILIHAPLSFEIGLIWTPASVLVSRVHLDDDTKPIDEAQYIQYDPISELSPSFL
jgi:hypothetical protein